MTNKTSSYDNNSEIIDQIAKNPELANSLSFIIQHQQQITHSGALPLASEVVKYNEVIPNGANRIMIMAEKEQEHNHLKTQKQLKHREEELLQRGIHLDVVKRGQIFSVAVIILYTCLSAYIAWIGDTITAGALMGTGVVGIVTALIYGNKKP